MHKPVGEILWAFFYERTVMGAEASKRCRDKKIKNGLCSQCGKDVLYKSGRCKWCHDKTIESKRLLRDQRFAEGLCTECGKPKKMMEKKDVPNV